MTQAQQWEPGLAVADDASFRDDAWRAGEQERQRIARERKRASDAA